MGGTGNRIKIEGDINHIMIDANDCPTSTEDEIVVHKHNQKRKHSPPLQVHIQVRESQKDIFAGMGPKEENGLKGKRLYDTMHKNKIDQVRGLLRTSKDIDDQNINTNNMK